LDKIPLYPPFSKGETRAARVRRNKQEGGW